VLQPDQVRSSSQSRSRRRQLIEAGQVQIGNHTYTHRTCCGSPTPRSGPTSNATSKWIESTFGISSRPSAAADRPQQTAAAASG
jgi:hypothetical protein